MKRLFYSIVILILVHCNINAQYKNDSIRTALLIIDIQNFYFPGEGAGLAGVIQASEKAKEILQIFRDKKQLVVHVRHKANKGFDIHKNVEPLSNEKVITKEEVNSFYKTGLLNYLNSNKINRLVIIGMQTHMCLEAAVRAAYDYGFECIVVEDACATRDLKYGDNIMKARDVHLSTLSTIVNGGYGRVTELNEFKENPDLYIFQKDE